MDFDPYESARRMNDQAALDSWARYERDLQSAPVIAIKPTPYLQYENPDETGEYGALPWIWEESIRQVLEIYEESLEHAVAELPGGAKLERRTYTPPSSYQRGGPFTYPTDLLQLVMDQKWLVNVGSDVVSDVVAAAVIASSIKMYQWMTTHKVLKSERILPSHSPYIVRAVVEAEAHRCFPNLMPGTATIEANVPLDADYPVNGSLFLVTLPYLNGSIIYRVDDRLQLQSVIRTTPKGAQELDSSCWLSD